MIFEFIQFPRRDGATGNARCNRSDGCSLRRKNGLSGMRKLPFFAACNLLSLLLADSVLAQKSQTYEALVESAAKGVEERNLLEGKAWIIDYVELFTRSSFKGRAEEQEKNISDYEKTLVEAGVEEQLREERLAMMRKELSEESKGSSEFQLIIAGDFQCLRKAIQNASGEPEAYWEIRRGSTHYQYFEGMGHLVIDDQARSRRRTTLDIVMERVGLLGRLSREDLDAIKAGELHEEGGGFRIVRGPMNLSFKQLDDKRWVPETIENRRPDSEFVERKTFGAFRDFGSILSPELVSVTEKTPGYDVATNYVIKEIRLGEVPSVPILNGFARRIRVNDVRFEHPIEYFAVSKLPDDEQVFKWLTDKEALQKYNKMMQGSSRIRVDGN